MIGEEKAERSSVETSLLTGSGAVKYSSVSMELSTARRLGEGSEIEELNSVRTGLLERAEDSSEVEESREVALWEGVLG